MNRDHSALAVFFSMLLSSFVIGPECLSADSPFRLLMDRVKPGSLVVVVADPATVGKSVELTAELLGLKAPFFETQREGERVYEAVLAVPHEQSPGSLKVSIQSPSGGTAAFAALPLEVVPGTYASELLRVGRKFTSPNKADLLRIKAEEGSVGTLYKQMTRRKYWDGAFRLPVDSRITSPFGTNRIFNGEVESYHSGLDLRAAVGTRIHAPAAGKVVFAKHLFFTGYTVILDHGYGLFTVYAHMSKIRVKLGTIVSLGTVLGAAGKTGRAKGPHLHWGAVVQGVKINPLDLTQFIE